MSANQKDWDVWIPSVLFAYLTAVHDSTGYSPYKLLFGREPKQPIDFQFPLPSSKPSATSPDHYFSALKRTLDSIREQSNQNLRTAQLSQKEFHDRRVTAEQFSIGDMVLVYNPVAHGSPKFQKHWEGPYLVVSKLAGGVTYMVRSVVDDKFLTVHRERLKLCNSEPVQEQGVQLVAAKPAVLDAAQHKLPNPPINQPAAPPLPPFMPPPANPIAALLQALQPVIGMPPQGVQAIQPIPPPLMALPVAPPAAAAFVAGRPRHNVHSPDRLANQYTPFLAEKPRHK